MVNAGRNLFQTCSKSCGGRLGRANVPAAALAQMLGWPKRRCDFYCPAVQSRQKTMPYIYKKLPQTMQKQPVGYIDTCRIQHFYAVKDVTLEGLAGRREVYFLGENGDGKSLILMGLMLAFSEQFIRHNTDWKETGRILDMVKANPGLRLRAKSSGGQVFESPGRPAASGAPAEHLPNLLAYGVHRSRNDSDRSSNLGFMTLFDADQYLINPEQWLQRLYARDLENKLAGRPGNELDAAQKILTDLLDQNVEIRVSSSGVEYVERGGAVLRFGQLSEGYRSVLTWVCDMVSRLAVNGVGNLADLTGVVLVDEVNLHLHPKWERQIARKLRQWFPGIQFFFTTHSPVSVLGASDDAVFYRVYKQAGETRISEPYLKTNMNDLMANTVITSPLFGLEDARMDSQELSRKSLDTSDTYLHSRVQRKIEARLQAQKASDEMHFSEQEIDDLIDQALAEELA